MSSKIFSGFALALAAFGSVAVTAASADPAIYDGITITEFKALVDQMGIVTVAEQTSDGTPFFALTDPSGKPIVLLTGASCPSAADKCQGIALIAPVSSNLPADAIKNYNSGYRYGYIVAKTDFSALQIFSMVQGGVTGKQIQNTVGAFFVDMDSLVKILTGKSAALPSGASPAFAGMTASRWADAAKDLGAHSAALAATPQSRATIEIEIDRVAKSPTK